ncbi:MAG: GAF domain-containing protein [Leptolyngbya sp. SIO1D8]|nr:GAF domain-containing protein [Leptolyngbya sp. SIO1D8]
MTNRVGRLSPRQKEEDGFSAYDSSSFKRESLNSSTFANSSASMNGSIETKGSASMNGSIETNNSIAENDPTAVNGEGSVSRNGAAPVARTAGRSQSEADEMSWRLTTNQPGKAKSLRFQLLRGLLPAVLLPLAIAGFVGERTMHERLEEDLSTQIRNEAVVASELTRDYLDELVAVTTLVAENPLVIEAAKSASQDSEELTELSIPEIEDRFANTRLLTPSQELNDYLAQTIETTDLAELFFTEQRGLNVAYSNPTSDFVQSDENWWQQTQINTRWISEPIFDESANTSGLEIGQAIIDPDSGEFLGVVKAVVSAEAERLKYIPGLLHSLGVKGSQQVQLIDASASKVLDTITAEGLITTDTILGGQLIEEIAITFRGALLSGDTDLNALKTRLQEQYTVQELELTQLATGSAKSIVVLSFMHEQRKYYFSRVGETNFLAIASIDNSELEAVGRRLVLVFAFVMLAAAGIATAVIFRLANQLSSPLRYLSSAAEEVAAGNLEVAAVPCGAQEAQTLAKTFNSLVARVRGFLQEQTMIADQARLLSDVTGSRIRNQQDLTRVFNQALTEARTALAVDRIVIYQFNADWSGYISHESVASGWPEALNNEIEDPCIPQALIEDYEKGRVVPTDDVFNAGFHPSHLQLMDRLKIKANLVVPILKEGVLFGLLIVHHCARPHVWQNSEVAFMQQLAGQLSNMLDRLTYLQAQEAETQRAQFMKDFALAMTQAATPDEVLDLLPLDEIRDVLQSDRVLVYRFDETWQGTITHESVGSQWPRALGAEIHDPCFEKDYVEKYQAGRVQAIADIHSAGLTSCHLQQLEPFAVQANLVAPIQRGGQLLGLLVAHQCSGPRHWQQREINFFAQLASQVGLAFDRSELMVQREVATKNAQSLATDQQEQKEALQMQLINLLSEVEGAASGDLTIRADVTAGEIGTVADFFNSIIESLRQIVTQVKVSAHQVNQSVGENEDAIRQLADKALSQAEDITHVLSSVENMTHSIQSVAESAHQAAQVARTASTTAETGSAAMARTEQNILMLRETVGTTAKQVKRLGESSQQISRVVSLINQIAVQTNLLAINAGIEAARAGEEGQGFAVVAEEVGELASRSAAATQEIEKIVDTIQRETAQVVEAMEQSTTQVVEGTRLVEDTKTSLAQILEVSHQIDQLVQSISDSTVSQVETSASVTELMQMVAEVSKQTSTSSLQVSDELRSTVAVAQELQASVGTFKVDSEG